MNKWQKIVVSAAVLFAAAMLAYPPWERDTGNMRLGAVDYPSVKVPEGYAPFYAPPSPSAHISAYSLGVQFAALALITFGVCWLLGRNRR